MTGAIGPVGRILTTGASGRIGKEVTKKLKGLGHSVVQIQRGNAEASTQNPQSIKVVDPASQTVSDWKEILKQNKIDMVLNLAAQSSGNFKSMMAVNVDMPKAMAEACKQLGIRMIHTCSHSAQLSGINQEEHPYAYTKKKGADQLEEYPNVVIARLGAVLGGKSDVPVLTDAAVSTWSPVILLPSEGGEQVFHPVDEETVIEAMTKMVEHLLDPAKEDQPLPKIIDIAGTEVPLKAFLKMVNPSAIGSVKVPEGVLNLLSVLVDKGVFTKEFVNLTKVSKSEERAKVRPDVSAMEKLLQVPTPSAEKVAMAAAGQLSAVNTSLMIGKALFKIDPNSPPPSVPKGIWPANFLEKMGAVNQLFSKTVLNDILIKG